MELKTGKELRDEGMARSLDNATKDNPEWAEMAFSALLSFAEGYGKPFMAEEVRVWACWIPNPKSKRAWGAIFSKAARKGIIRKIGYGQVMNPKAHCANACMWVKA